LAGRPFVPGIARRGPPHRPETTMPYFLAWLLGVPVAAVVTLYLIMHL
jgi:hypothetical protein